jgi:hypothetical protein
LLFLGQITTLTAVDTERTYNWSVTDWEGNPITGAGTSATGAISLALNPDTLFEARGAGIYTVTVVDSTRPVLSQDFFIRVPMKVIPGAGNYTDDQGAVIFTVSGGPVGNVYSYHAFDLSGAPVTAANCGQFAHSGIATGNSNDFNITQGIPALITFRVNVALDTNLAGSNPDVARLIDAGLDSVWTGIFYATPVSAVTYYGHVVTSDGITAVVGAEIVATHDPAIRATTDSDGLISLVVANFNAIGITYKFAVSAAGYINKMITDQALDTASPTGRQITLEAIGTGQTISGTITLSDDPVPYLTGTGTVSIQVKADGRYVRDGAGDVITVYADTATGNYISPVPGDYTGAGTFVVEARKRGYIFGEFATGATRMGISADISGPLAANLTGIDLSLKPVTHMYITSTALDMDADGTNDRVQISVTARSAGAGGLQFDGTGTEISLVAADGTALTLDSYGSVAANTWTYTHNAYENFSFTVKADVSDDRNVADGYEAILEWHYVKTATATDWTTIVSPNINGGNLQSSSSQTVANLPPGSLTGDIVNQVRLIIVEADAGGAGAGGVTGSGIVDVMLIGEDGQQVDNANLQRIEITMRFDPTVVTTGSLESGAYVILQANSLDDIVNGVYTTIPVSQIITPIDYNSGIVIFWVNHLSAFGVGAAPAAVVVPPVAGGGGGGGGCFIDTMANGWTSSMMVIIGVLLSALVVFCLLARRRRN